MNKEIAKKIQELKIERMNLIMEYNGDRYNTALAKEERRIVAEIEKLLKEVK